MVLQGFGHSVISTDDNVKWQKQRSHFTEAFLPNASLAQVSKTKIIPTFFGGGGGLE